MMNGTNKYLFGRVKTVLITIFMLYAIFLLSAPAFAHTPGAPRLEEVTLDPIYVMDGGRRIEITLDSFKSYYSDATEGNSSIKSVFAVCAYRAVQKAFAELWEEEIPRREDILITSTLPIPHSLLFLHMVAVGDPLELTRKENFTLIHKATNSIVENLSFDHLKALSQSADYQDFEYQITRRGTGKTILLSIDKKAFGTDYLALWKKAIFSIPEAMTAAEQLRYSASYHIADKLMRLEEYELFSNVSRPVTIKTCLEGFLGIMMTGGILAIIVVSPIMEFRKNRKIKR